MEKNEYCIAYEVPLQEVPADMIEVCKLLGDQCETCSHRCTL